VSVNCLAALFPASSKTLLEVSCRLDQSLALLLCFGPSYAALEAPHRAPHLRSALRSGKLFNLSHTAADERRPTFDGATSGRFAPKGAEMVQMVEEKVGNSAQEESLKWGRNLENFQNLAHLELHASLAAL